MASKVKQKRTRAHFTRSQIDELKRAFAEDCFINRFTRAELSQRIKLTETQIKVWFSNRRSIHRRRQRDSKTNSKSTDTVQYSLNDSSSDMNQSMSETSNYSVQSHQMYESYQPLIHQFHMQMRYGVGPTIPMHQIQNSMPAYPNWSLTSRNPTITHNLTNSLPSSVTSLFHEPFNFEENPFDSPSTTSTTNSLPLPIFPEFHQSFNLEESSPDHCISPPTSNTTVGLNNSKKSYNRTSSDTIASIPSHITMANNNLYSPWSYISSQPLQPISFSDIQSSSGNQMEYITFGLSMHHRYPSSFIQQNLPTYSALSDVRNIPQQ